MPILRDHNHFIVVRSYDFNCGVATGVDPCTGFPWRMPTAFPNRIDTIIHQINHTAWLRDDFEDWVSLHALL